MIIGKPEHEGYSIGEPYHDMPGWTRNMAMFCDFENIALGVHDANYAQFDIGKVVERLLLKGDIIVRNEWD